MAYAYGGLRLRLIRPTRAAPSRQGYLAGRLGVRVSWRRHDTWENAARFASLSDTLGLLRILAALWAERPAAGEPVKVGMVLADLVPATQETLPLFADGTRSPGLDAAFDRVRSKYGNDALYFGGAFLAAHEAPMRISFNHVPDVALESDELAAP